jgi:hypothetical protein
MKSVLMIAREHCERCEKLVGDLNRLNQDKHKFTLTIMYIGTDITREVVKTRYPDMVMLPIVFAVYDADDEIDTLCRPFYSMNTCKAWTLNKQSDEKDVTLKVSKNQNFTKQSLSELLAQNVVNINYLKSNDEVRDILCTTQESLIPAADLPKNTGKKKPDHLVAVYDLEKHAWRSVKLNGILSYKVTDSVGG